MPLTPRLATGLGNFFETIREDWDFFHPHPLTAEHAADLCRRETRDIYLVGVESDTVIAYGLLRGWDEGYETPSLGIAVHPAKRGQGVARKMMLALHQAAAERGATAVRLTVSRRNTGAIQLYESLGYVLDDMNDDELVGLLHLDRPQTGGMTAVRQNCSGQSDASGRASPPRSPM